MIDFSYQEDIPVISNPLDLVLEQLDMLLDTSYGDVLGASGYGNDFDTFLYEMNQSNFSIQSHIENVIRKNVNLHGCSLSINVNLFAGIQRDIILVQIMIAYSGSSYIRTFKIE